MIEIVYTRHVPHPRSIVLSQYFDLEHLEFVHPRSFGRTRLVWPGVPQTGSPVESGS